MPAKSKKQQRFFGLVHAVQSGKAEAPSKEIGEAADTMTTTDVSEFASTEHEGLPEKKATSWIRCLTPEERAGAMRLGMYLKCSEYGLAPHQIDGVMKTAAMGIADTIGGASKLTVALALLTGVPLGIASHIIGRRITQQRKKETELQHQTHFYRDATQNLEAGLAAAGANV